MKGADLKAFRKANNLTQEQLGEFLGIKKSFVSTIESGKDPMPKAKLSKLLESPHGWDVSMLTQPDTPVYEPKADALVDYLQKKVEDQDVLIRELYQQIGMLEAKLDLLNKRGVAETVVPSSCANVG